MPLTQHIALIGGGAMGEALARGLRRAGADPARLTLCVRRAERRQALADLGARLEADNAAALAAEVILLCVKPGAVPAVLDEIGPRLEPRHLLISIAAGLPLARVEGRVPAGTRLIRAMPNLPLTVGEGATALARGANATDADLALARTLFEASGKVVELPESALDAATGLSGSGPAYVFLFIEALADGGVSAGLPRAAAQLLAAQTVLGAARLLLESGEHPAVWKDRVATPGGTTIAGLVELERGAARHSAIRAVEAAARRARELSGAD